ncbi:MAG: formylglycine-generating enzyme family protein [Planctomycetota bacterium]
MGSDRSEVGGASDGANGSGATGRRMGRLGALLDFVAVGRPGDRADQFLLVDRFESTRADWAQFSESDAGRAVRAEDAMLPGNAALPASSMTLQQAAAFAHWRFGRLPTAEEWRLVALGAVRDGTRFPWGQRPDATHANTASLGLFEPTPVGTFESGRRLGADIPYDLVGNVREWTQTVPDPWFVIEGVGESGSYRGCWLQAYRTPALAAWASAGPLLPSGLMIAAGGPRPPREVVGGDFETPMANNYALSQSAQSGNERMLRTGLRVYTTVGELLARLVAHPGSASPEMLDQVDRFLRMGQHQRLFADAYAESPFAALQLPAEGLGGLLQARLGAVASGGGR